jgi:hypothetical protein
MALYVNPLEDIVENELRKGCEGHGIFVSVLLISRCEVYKERQRARCWRDVADATVDRKREKFKEKRTLNRVFDGTARIASRARARRLKETLRD